jgi:hypothetical protein
VRNSFTEKCENCTTALLLTLTTAIKLEHVDRTASSGSSGRQSASNLGFSPSSKSNARNSASSSTRRGRGATVMHWKSRCAYTQFSSSISSNVRSYVPSKVPGNSSSARRMRPGRQRRSLSSWQNTHRNLYGGFSSSSEHRTGGTPHIPLAPSTSPLITSSFSSCFHLRVFVSVFTKEMI